MKIPMFPPALILCLSLILLSCSGEEMEALQAEDLNAANLEVYETKDLEGIWNLESMIADVAVDFNDDGTSNKDIKAETNCFNEMSYEFKADGKVIATQAKLHINTTGIASCDEGVYSSTYTLDGDMLTIKFHDKDGVSRSTTKKIILTDDKQSLHISLTRLETSGYINDDSGNSTAVIDSIATVYKKRTIVQ